MKNNENEIKTKSHYERNKELYKKRAKDYYSNNIEKQKIRDKKYRDNDINKEKRREYDKTRNEYRKNYTKQRLKNDPCFKIAFIFRNRFNKLIKKNKTNKNNSILKYLGCTVEECKHHIEQQFRFEMNWSNHGKVWEIDHIKPCSKFNLIIEEEKYKCFHYSNLQPLFKTENRQKYNKYE